MISINQTRNVVMRLLNKTNNGYISPDEFNDFANLAQMDIFENLFYQYANWLNKENKRMSNSEYANIPKNIREQIDVFATYTTPLNFTYNLGTNLWSYTGTDLYRAENLSLVNAQGKKTDIEELRKSEVNRVQNSNYISPSFTYPAYERVGDSFRIFPTLTTGYSAELFFIRRPKTPKWTYVNVQGNPVFNAGATDLQNIELHPSNFVSLITKIMGYCGVSIREEQIVQASKEEEILLAQKQS
jgi:hypothetical protein